MNNTTIKYILYDHGGSGRRGHHFGPGNNLIDPAHGHASPGDEINAIAFPFLDDGQPRAPVFGNLVSFAFMSVHGARDGNHLYTRPGSYTVSVGHNDIDILVVYVPPTGLLDAQHVAWIDAFNVDTGDFSDSAFLEDLNPREPNPMHSIEYLSDVGNNTGIFRTVDSYVDSARVYEIVDGAPFLGLKEINFHGAAAPIDLIPNRELSSVLWPSGITGTIWFAFFQNVPSVAIRARGAIDRLQEALDGWAIDDFCGTPHGRIPPHGPFNFEIRLNEVILAELTGKQEKKIKGYLKAYPKIAESAYKRMQKVLDILKGVSDVLSKF